MIDDMAGKAGRPDELGKGITLILRELADFRAEAAEDRKQAAEDRKQAAEDRKQAEEDRRQAAEDRRQAAEDRKEAAKDRKELTQVLRVIASEGRKFRVAQDELLRAVRQQGVILMKILRAVEGGRNGRGNGHPPR
jgi:FtsZ-interacting cell division protein ZipA